MRKMWSASWGTGWVMGPSRSVSNDRSAKVASLLFRSSIIEVALRRISSKLIPRRYLVLGLIMYPFCLVVLLPVLPYQIKVCDLGQHKEMDRICDWCDITAWKDFPCHVALPSYSSIAAHRWLMSLQCLEANPDISGLGVRIAFYAQTLALVLLTGRSLEEALSSVWTLLGTSFGLAVSALVTAAQAQLPLYQAIIVTDLVWLANFAIFMALAAYNRHPRGSRVVQYCAIAQTYVSMGCVLYIWSQADQLDGDGGPDEDKTIFVVMFASVNATGHGRTIALTITSLLLAAYSVVAGLFLWKRVPPLVAQSLQARRAKPKPSPKRPDPLSLSLPLTSSVSAAPSSAASNASTFPPPSRHRPRAVSTTTAPPSLPFDPHLLILTVLFLPPYLVTLICTELQIVRNDICPASNNSWGFGQVLALSVTIVPFVITCQAFWRYGIKQRKRDRDRERHNHGPIPRVVVDQVPSF
ncbi:F-box domain-containing protein [Mycena indigotica]|uniref:F-box domain-containing protein n=1 Tax=Mycena indigotica TaxID=2126181 RepID=A0A8H6SST5_9AGAR|nr:F-box domain-containing protein [Mycena indigotica]KAF7304046.1 F-box domain-containing protein [Mycena indigotica]